MKRVILFRSLVIIVYIAYSIKHIFSTVMTHSIEFYNHAMEFFGDVDKVYEVVEITDSQRLVNHFLILFIASGFYYYLSKLSRQNKWFWFLIVCLISTPILSFFVSSIDRWINPWFFLFYGSQISVKTEILTLFQHLMLKNAIAIFSWSMFAACLFQIEELIIELRSNTKKLERTSMKLFLAIPIFWTLLIVAFFWWRGEGTSLNLFAGSINLYIELILFQSLIAFLIITDSKLNFIKYFVFTLGFSLALHYVEVFGTSALGDYFFYLFETPAIAIGLFYTCLFSILIPVLIKIAFSNYLTNSSILAGYKSELSNLKSQINPHFLFNSLNSLYGLALEESSPKTSTGIQKLSEMMRFMLRENVEDSIEVSKEIEYIENYIELQKLRVDGNEKVRLEYDIDKACEGKITPMLIIPFIENAFKHGVSTHLESWIDIKLKCEKGSIHLNVKNSNHRKTKSTEEESGIGLENVRQRLAMLYPNKHLFQIFDNYESFEINLKIELN